jgi:hypothetical protein
MPVASQQHQPATIASQPSGDIAVDRHLLGFAVLRLDCTEHSGGASAQCPEARSRWVECEQVDDRPAAHGIAGIACLDLSGAPRVHDADRQQPGRSPIRVRPIEDALRVGRNARQRRRDESYRSPRKGCDELADIRKAHAAQRRHILFEQNR